MKIHKNVISMFIAAIIALSVSVPSFAAPKTSQIDTIVKWATKQKDSHVYDLNCQKFVGDAYREAGIDYSRLTALLAWQSWGQSTSKNPPKGACVYFKYGSDGHAGIYDGNGNVIHAYGSRGVIIQDFNELCKEMPYLGWGFQGMTRGDVDEDGDVDNDDVSLLMNYICEFDVKINEMNADASNDGIVNIYDITVILRYLDGLGWN